MNKALLAFFAGTALAVSAAGHAACNEDTANSIRSSNMDDQGKVNMLRGIGCDATDLAQKVQADRQTGLENNRKRNEQIAAKEKAEREAKEKKSLDELNVQIEADNARRDAFDQEMADKCGEYPLDLKIGLSEKLLKLGCAGQANLVGEAVGGRVYRVYGALVSVQKGRVVRWVRE